MKSGSKEKAKAGAAAKAAVKSKSITKKAAKDPKKTVKKYRKKEKEIDVDYTPEPKSKEIRIPPSPRIKPQSKAISKSKNIASRQLKLKPPAVVLTKPSPVTQLERDEALLFGSLASDRITKENLAKLPESDHARRSRMVSE